MKIAVISDIHANKNAYDKVMEDIEKFCPDKIFCLGDLILAGYNPNYIGEKILKLKETLGEDFEIIQGNTDKMVANCTSEMIEKTKKAFPCMGYSLEDDIKITYKTLNSIYVILFISNYIATVLLTMIRYIDSIKKGMSIKYESRTIHL